MNWITQAELRRDTPQARQLASQLLNSARWNGGHDLVWNLFAGDSEAGRDFVYREAGPGRFLIVSVREPRAEPAVWTTKTRPYAPKPTAGDSFGFSLRANPTVSLSMPGRARSHRADVLMDAKRRKGAPLDSDEKEQVALSWLLARAERLGVRFDPDRCGTRRNDQLTIPRPADSKTRKAARPALLTVVDYEGVLTVEDPERLGVALTGGVGSGKAFGLGLLLLRLLTH